jgi:hypothetical protein
LTRLAEIATSQDVEVVTRIVILRHGSGAAHDQPVETGFNAASIEFADTLKYGLGELALDTLK